MSELLVVAPGWGTTMQDGGRPGFAAFGVPPSGALDEPMRQLLNRLLGNPPDAAVLETLGGLRVSVDGVAVTLATSAELAPVTLGTGAEVFVTPAAGATWGYLAVRGGFAVERVLGSRSTDVRSGLGPLPITAGTRIPIGHDPGTPIVVDQAPPALRTTAVADVHIGPRLDWFEPGVFEQLVGSDWTVSGDRSRVGARLDGPALRRRVAIELPSEGMVIGAVQVPPDGRPIVMLADHPTIGGYPVLAVVDQRSLAAVAQAPVGSRLRFRPVR